MKQTRHTFYALIAGTLVAGTLLGMTVQKLFLEDNTYQNLQKLEDAFSLITKRYVEDVDSAELSRDAIEGMLEGLDPHSVFIDAERMQSVREGFDASFEGIGVSYEWTEGVDGKDSLTVLNPIPGGPSEEAGLLPGDRIIGVDEHIAVGWDREDVERHLKGPKGTRVVVTVKRPQYHELLEFEITRDKIPIHTVDAHYMLDEQTGYIRLNRFARTTRQEVRDALGNLKRQGMGRLVFDMRGNSGGYMNMAIGVADEFLGGDQMIVYTRSRHVGNNEEYHARVGGLFEARPIIVLVDENSASASEIVAGALQDHDRALIVGRRTFGKGLVQQQFSLRDGSVLQLTTSRYYTPAGRLIQTPYESGDRESYYEQKSARYDTLAEGNGVYTDLDHLIVEALEKGELQTFEIAEYLEFVPDSLKYATDNGRVVLGGGGILPDFVVVSPVSPLMRTLYAFDHLFVRQWMESHPGIRSAWEDRQEAFNREFVVDDAAVDAFWEYAAEEHNVHVVPEGEEVPENAPDGQRYVRAEEVEEDLDLLKARLKAYMARRMWGVSAWFPVIQEVDPTLQSAMKLWESAGKLSLNYQ